MPNRTVDQIDREIERLRTERRRVIERDTDRLMFLDEWDDPADNEEYEVGHFRDNTLTLEDMYLNNGDSEGRENLRRLFKFIDKVKEKVNG